MKPSEFDIELSHARKNPTRYTLLLFCCIALGVGAFYGSKYVNGELDSACENPVYVSMDSEACGVLEYKSGSADQCGVAEYKVCRSGTGCGWQKLGGVIDIGKARANECRAPACGVASYKTCKHSDFGVEKYKTCRHSGHGLERCDDPPPWKFWT